jgi:hypothetical protein
LRASRSADCKIEGRRAFCSVGTRMLFMSRAA